MLPGSQFFLPLYAYSWTYGICRLAIFHSAVDSSKGINTHFDIGEISNNIVLMCLTRGIVHFERKGRMCPYLNSLVLLTGGLEVGFKVSVIRIDFHIQMNLSYGEIL